MTPCWWGFLAGRPAEGHIALVGSTESRTGIGSLLLSRFAEHAATAGATELTVVLDSRRAGGWERRRFFEATEFTPVRSSAVHFAKPLP
ncbi:hypothetical protein [Nocardia sp. NPDC050710]|uniref:hypothetical protein n=1 Tax=Nocardia sp. NPDC050710 TaxID=3157220 RepID=UPI0033E2F6B5